VVDAVEDAAELVAVLGQDGLPDQEFGVWRVRLRLCSSRA
jgi:hypothetical protein